MLETLRKNIRYIAAIAMIPVAAGLWRGWNEYIDRVSPQPRPPQFRDVNGDGIEDKIIQARVAIPMGFAYVNTPELGEIVLYGVKINEETVYVPKRMYDDLQYLKSK